MAPIEKTSVAAAAFDQLIAFVVKGNWKTGQRIPPERELCRQLGIARTSLREALKAMEMIGMLDSRVGDGTFVCPRTEFLARPLLWSFTGMDREELRDIMEARMFLEKDLAGLAAQRASDSEIDRIGEAVQMLRRNMERSEPILDADMEFHMSVAEAAHNDIMKNAVQLLRNLMREWIRRKLLIPEMAADTFKQHTAIFQAIRRRNEDGARDAMQKHLSETVALVVKVVEGAKRVKLAH